jgi:hypothetical protein
MTLRTFPRMLTLFVIAACLPALSRSAAAPAPAPAATPKSATERKPMGKASVYTPRNHHLHISATSASAASGRSAIPHERSTHAHSTTTARRLRHTPRSMATVSGTVRDARGGPATAARVWLAKANGRRIRNPHARHATHADSTGGYSMRSVKSGRYRVVAAKRGAGRGHNGVTIRSGGAHHANVTLKGGRGKVRRRR